MIVQGMDVGPFMTVAYIVGDEETKEGAILDPGGDVKRLKAEADRLGLDIKQIILTHGHPDHTAGVKELKDLTGAEVIIHEDDAGMLTSQILRFAALLGIKFTPCPADRTVREGDTIKIGGVELEILHTPGHSKGGMTLVNRKDKAAFVGDSVFAGSIGRTDFPGCSHKVLIDSIKQKIMTLGDDYTLYPGHGPATNVAVEKASNPFLTGNDSFLF